MFTSLVGAWWTRAPGDAQPSAGEHRSSDAGAAAPAGAGAVQGWAGLRGARRGETVKGSLSALSVMPHGSCLIVGQGAWGLSASEPILYT
jgi:hypothetical protein